MFGRKKTNTQFRPVEYGDYLIKEIASPDAEKFRSFYLHILKDAPQCSADAYEDKKAEGEETWAKEIEESYQDPRSILCAIIHKPTNGYVGLIKVKGTTESKLSHEAHVRAFYMDASHQDQAILKLFWQMVLKHLQQFTDINKVKVAVVTSERQLILFLNQLGFVRYGFDESYVKVGRKYLDAILMLKHL